ncbi:MAG TPA: hypothetical protein ENK67_03435 [Flavobacteriia bacterium]|nr:hypothetical protein [Flavobacteriia bacterium]
MSYYRKTNLFLILFSLGLISFLGILSFTSIQSELEETEKIDAFFAGFEDLNQYAVKDTIKPKVVTYSQLQNFNEDDNYLHNRKDVSKSVTTYSKTNKVIPKKKHYDVSNRISTYSETANAKKKKKYDVSKLVSVYKEPKKPTKRDIHYKPIVKEQQQITVNKTVKVSKPTFKEDSKKVTKKAIESVKTKKTLINTKPVTKKASKKIIKKSIESAKPKKEIKKIVAQKLEVNKKQVTKTISSKKEVIYTSKTNVKKQQAIKKKQPELQYKKENSPTLHYKNRVLNTATNINLVQFAPTYPSCNKNLSEDEKKSCLLTNVSKFVLDNFDSDIGKKAGLKKGFYEIRVLFVIDKNGISKTYKVLGKFDPIIKSEIRRIINNLPKMIPGKSNGRNVPVKYSVKVLFEVKF